eukprot:967555_1
MEDNLDIFNKDETESVCTRLSRLSLDIGSSCAVYSRSVNKWVEGRIAKIFVDTQTNEEWFIVKYGNNKSKKMQRFCTDLRSTQNQKAPHKDIFNKDESEFVCDRSDYTKCDT